MNNRHILLAGVAMTAAELAAGRYLRSPDGHKNKPQPQPQTTVENRGEDNLTVRTEQTGEGATEGGANDVQTDTETVVAFKPRATNKFAKLASNQATAMQSKQAVIAEAKKRLKETHEHSSKEGAAAEAALEPANKAALLLYNGLNDGAISLDEMNEMLAAEFGFKMKKDKTPSKTPAGYGEEIRKRVQRAVKAYDYAINGNEPVAFYEPIPREDVVPFINEIKNGKRTLFAFYKAIGEFKSKAMGTRPKAAFDPRRIAGLTRDILGDVQATVRNVNSTPGLEAAYMGLWRALSIIGQELPDEEPQAEAAA